MTEGDYLSLLTKEVEKLMDRHMQETQRAPRMLYLPKSSYVILEDYCLAMEREVYLKLLLRSGQVEGSLKRQLEAKIRIAQARIEQLSAAGVRFLSCKYGQIPIVVERDRTHIEIR